MVQAEYARLEVQLTVVTLLTRALFLSINTSKLRSEVAVKVGCAAVLPLYIILYGITKLKIFLFSKIIKEQKITESGT